MVQVYESEETPFRPAEWTLTVAPKAHGFSCEFSAVST